MTASLREAALLDAIFGQEYRFELPPKERLDQILSLLDVNLCQPSNCILVSRAPDLMLNICHDMHY